MIRGSRQDIESERRLAKRREVAERARVRAEMEVETAARQRFGRDAMQPQMVEEAKQAYLEDVHAAEEMVRLQRERKEAERRTAVAARREWTPFFVIVALGFILAGLSTAVPLSD